MKKKLWMSVKRYDLQDATSLIEPQSNLCEVVIEENITSGAVLKIVVNTLKLPESGVVFKLRNHRGSLIPLSSAIMSNSKSVPYVLEVVKEHQYIQPKEKAMKRKMHDESMKRVMEGFMQRLERLEGKLPDLNNRKQEKTEQDLKYIEGKLVFLNKRFDEAERSHWSGMFQKNPMW